jgi:hypothetical protein
MIKKTILLVTAVMIAASSLSHAAKPKSFKITNESNTTYYYKVGNSTPKKITAGSSRSFSLKGLKRVKITSGTSKSGNSVKGDKRTYPTLSISQAKADPLFQTNPVSGQTTDLTK